MSQKSVSDERKERLGRQVGVSLIELLIVLAIISFLTAISVPLASRYTRSYKTEDQAIKIMDLMREAGQLAMTRRRTMRFELDGNDPAQPIARIIDETGAVGGTVLKSIPLEPENIVRMDEMPNGFAVPTPPNFPAVTVDGIVSARFRSDGSVRNAADLPISGTVILWPPINEPEYDSGNLTPRRSEEVRAITMDGSSGAMRFWKYDGSSWLAAQ